jgi:hypothetical protein
MITLLPLLTTDELLKLKAYLRIARNTPDKLGTGLDKELTALLLPVTAPVGAEVAAPASDEQILGQVEKMLNEASQLSDGSTNLTTSERIALFKAQAQLVEKWVSNRERVLNVKQMAEFQQVVISYMDAVLTPDQRTSFMDSLRQSGVKLS